MCERARVVGIGVGLIVAAHDALALAAFVAENAVLALRATVTIPTVSDALSAAHLVFLGLFVANDLIVWRSGTGVPISKRAK